MKIARALGIALLVVVALLVAGAVYLAATFDSARIKREAVALVKEKTGRTLVIAGDLGLSFWPGLGVRVDKATLSERDAKDNFAAVESVHVSVRLLPLLSKRIVVDRVSLDGLLLILKRDREGRLNVDDLLRRGAAPVDANAGEPAAARQFDIAGIDVSNARLEWHDQEARRDVVLSPLDFETGRVAGDANGISIRDAKLATRGKFDSDSVEVRLDLPALVRRADRLTIDRLALDVKLKGAQRAAEAHAEINGVDGTLPELAAKDLTLRAAARLGEKEFQAQLQSPVHLDLDAGSLTLPLLTGRLTIDVPGMPKRPLQLPVEARLLAHYREPDVSGTVKTAFDDTKASASFDAGPFSPLKLTLDIDADKLDLDRYLPVEAKQASGAGSPLDLTALKGLDAKGSLRIGDFRVKQLKMRNLRVDFRSSNGRLELAPHSADLYGGRVSGNASFDADDNAVAMKESLANIDIAALLKDAADKDPIEGRGDVSLDVTTHGASVEAMKKVLAGTARVSLRDGAIKGINLARSLREAKTRLHGEGATEQASASAADKTDFSELRASFRIADGVARNDDLMAKSPFLRIGGKGDVDIGKRRLDYLLLASVVGTAAGQGGKELDALKGVTVPVRVSGPFDKPAFKLDYASLASDAAKGRIAEKRDEAKQKLQENLKDRLKGLFDK